MRCTILQAGDRPCGQPAVTQTKELVNVNRPEYLCEYHTTLFESLTPVITGVKAKSKQAAGQEQRKCSKLTNMPYQGSYCTNLAVAVTRDTNEPYCEQHIPSYTNVIML